MRQLGKWKDPSVPKSGWVCRDVEDLEDDSAICEMCETKSIRYVHVMEHDEYPDRLRCGCVCTGRMEGDEEAAVKREMKMKANTKKRRSKHNAFVKLPDGDWLVSVYPATASTWIKQDNETERVYLGQQKNGSWGVLAIDRGYQTTPAIVARDLASEEAAKQAALRRLYPPRVKFSYAPHLDESAAKTPSQPTNRE